MKENTKQKRLKICPVTALPEGRGASVKREGGSDLALFNIGGKFYATGNRCPHRGHTLSDSRIYDNVVECDLHGWRFDIRNGDCLTAPDCPLETFPVEIEDGFVYILA